MISRLCLTSISFVFITLVFGQTSESKLNKAFEFYDAKQFDSSYKLFTSLKNEMPQSDSLFKDVAFGLTASVYFKELSAKNAEDWNSTILLATEFLNYLTVYKNFVAAGLVEKKYFAYKDLIVAYSGLKKKDSAQNYRLKLYGAYKNKELPDGIDKYYNFEKLKWKGLNVWGYEWYPNLGDKETEGSFSKHVYYVYSTDSNGDDKDQLFRLHTIKIHKLTPDNPKADYVLTFKKPDKDGNEGSRTLWSYVFKNPVDYFELQNAVMEFLEKNEAQILQMVNQK